MSRAHVLLALGSCCVLARALDMKWTPNGEAPAPFSTRAREQMGMDPSAFAGAEPSAAPGSTLRLGVAMLAAIYFANNWNVVIAMQAVFSRLIDPLLALLRKGAEQKQRR